MMKLLTIQEIDPLTYRGREIRRNDNFITWPNQKWIDRRLITFEENGQKRYLAYYCVYDTIIDKLYWCEGYIDNNYSKIKNYYLTIGE